MTTNTSQIPSWQKKIRQAQAEENAKIEAYQAAMDAEQREQDLENAAHLKWVLHRFGIEANPTRNSWIEDVYEFFLGHAPGPRLRVAAFSRSDNGLVKFSLYVKRLDTETLCKERGREFPPHGLIRGEYLREKGIDEGWQQVMAQLADALDELDRKHAEILQRMQETATANQPSLPSANTSATSDKPTSAEKIGRLIEGMIEKAVHDMGHA